MTTKSAWILALGIAWGFANAADHMDLPTSVAGGVASRPDAQITDFYSFIAGSKLVLVMNVNPNLDPEVQSYTFPTDVKYRFNVDLNSQVAVGTDVVSKEFGGVIANPGAIAEDLVFEVTFDARNKPKLRVTGGDASRCDLVRLRTRVFTGLRAETFIFAPFVRNNVGSIVLEVPVNAVVHRQSKLLLWATTTVDLPGGPFTELGGRALRSQFGPFTGLNALPPRQHVAAGFTVPDVVVLDTAKPTAFPNGRYLADDVVDIVATFTSLPTDPGTAAAEVAVCSEGGPFFPCPVAPSATADDIRILGRFPYLGRPYKPSERTAQSTEID